MKKYLMIVCMMLVSTAMFAQKGTTGVGVQANYGMHSDYKNFGIGAKVQYEFIDNWRGEASADYFFKKDNLSQWDVNLNLHYLFHVGSNVTIYPLAGFSLMESKVSAGGVSVSDSDFGFNVGGGVEFPISDAIKFNVEAKYQYINDFDRPVLSAGVVFAL
jgi:outer membrane protein X